MEVKVAFLFYSNVQFESGILQSEIKDLKSEILKWSQQVIREISGLDE